MDKRLSSGVTCRDKFVGNRLEGKGGQSSDLVVSYVSPMHSHEGVEIRTGRTTIILPF